MGVSNPNVAGEARIKAPEGFLDVISGWPDGPVASNGEVDNAAIDIQAWQYSDCEPLIMLGLHIDDMIPADPGADPEESTRAGVILDLDTARLLRDTLTDYIERASRPMLRRVK